MDRAPRRKIMSVEENELARKKGNKFYTSVDGPGFIWPGLEVKNSPGKGNGVFATKDIPRARRFPFLVNLSGVSQVPSKSRIHE